MVNQMIKDHAEMKFAPSWTTDAREQKRHSGLAQGLLKHGPVARKVHAPMPKMRNVFTFSSLDD